MFAQAFADMSASVAAPAAASSSATATEHGDAAPERRVANDGVAYTYADFAYFYAGDAAWRWEQAHPAFVLFSAAGDAAATEHSAQARASTEDAQAPTLPLVLLLLEPRDIEQLQTEERSYEPRRNLHDAARDALNAITVAGYSSNMVRNLEPWFPWRPYVACHAQAGVIIGSGITLAVAEFIEGTKDPNRGGQPRLDFVFYRTDGSYCRLHPGPKKRGDAKPVVHCCPAQDPATEQISLTYDAARRVPQIDRMGKKQAYLKLQEADLGPLATESAAFKWWLFICNLGDNTRYTIGSGIVAATLEEKWDTGVQLLSYS
jgi:hypothetical protein